MVYCALHKRFCGPGDLAPPSLLGLVLSYWFFQGKPSLEKVEPGATPPRPPPGGGQTSYHPYELFVYPTVTRLGWEVATVFDLSLSGGLFTVVFA